MELMEPDLTGDERTLLTQFLDYYRSVMVRKVDGLTSEQLATRVGKSELTLAGLIKHLALVEESWFEERLLGMESREPWITVDWDADPDWEFHTAVDDDPAELLARYELACQRARDAVASVDDLETMTIRPNRRGELFNLRWVLIHMIEEYARHAGHADVLRENIDGVTGD